MDSWKIVTLSVIGCKHSLLQIFDAHNLECLFSLDLPSRVQLLRSSMADRLYFRQTGVFWIDFSKKWLKGQRIKLVFKMKFATKAIEFDTRSLWKNITFHFSSLSFACQLAFTRDDVNIYKFSTAQPKDDPCASFPGYVGRSVVVSSDLCGLYLKQRVSTGCYENLEIQEWKSCFIGPSVFQQLKDIFQRSK